MVQQPDVPAPPVPSVERIGERAVRRVGDAAADLAADPRSEAEAPGVGPPTGVLPMVMPRASLFFVLLPSELTPQPPR
jgi:hypothetical protein